ncbi:hypothetical protein EZV62_020626 [Acer yangbiense]|uniref:Uncharacterized protein n=1 Tax=Acer yangbiense TaxID=1000413 RepID=A0A5C7HEB9_9ROSI|nr:hypothetical protein EZV62_020626 [Acer yangbiense]
MMTASGRLRQATSVLLHSTGHAAEFVDLLIGSRRSIGGVEKVRMLCGVLLSNRHLDFFQTQEDVKVRVKEVEGI